MVVGGGSSRFLWGASLWQIFHVGMLALFTFLHVHWFIEAWRETFIQCWCQFASIIAWIFVDRMGRWFQLRPSLILLGFPCFSLNFSRDKTWECRDFIGGAPFWISWGLEERVNLWPFGAVRKEWEKKKKGPSFVRADYGWIGVVKNPRWFESGFNRLQRVGRSWDKLSVVKNALKFRTEWQDVIWRIALTSKELTKNTE